MIYCLVDMMNLLYRTAWTLQDLRNQETGVKSGHAYGSLDILRSLKARYSIDKLILVWDSKLPEDSPDRYKAGRAETDLRRFVESVADEFHVQMQSLGFSCLKLVPVEADYLIAFHVRQLVEQGNNSNNIYIYSTDRDFYCLTDMATIIYPKRGGDVFIKEKEAIDFFRGTPVSRIPIFRAFTGDSSDNLKGPPRLPRDKLVKMINHADDKTIIEKLKVLEGLFFRPFFSSKHVANILSLSDQIIENYSLSNIRKMEIPEEMVVTKEADQFKIDQGTADFLNYFGIKEFTPSKVASLVS